MQSSLDKLTAAELTFRRGTPPDARYIFKHALVRDTAYQSLLKGRRQQLHARIAEILEQRFPDTIATEPELLARHYTAAGLTQAGAHYWERAGARATERSAFVEAINHYRKGLELLSALSDGPERNQLELSFQMGLGDALSWTQGFAAAEVEAAYSRAHELSRQMGETVELFRILWGLWHFFVIRADLAKAQELAPRSRNSATGSRTHPLRRTSIGPSAKPFSGGASSLRRSASRRNVWSPGYRRPSRSQASRTRWSCAARGWRWPFGIWATRTRLSRPWTPCSDERRARRIRAISGRRSSSLLGFACCVVRPKAHASSQRRPYGSTRSAATPFTLR